MRHVHIYCSYLATAGNIVETDNIIVVPNEVASSKKKSLRWFNHEWRPRYYAFNVPHRLCDLPCMEMEELAE